MPARAAATPLFQPAGCTLIGCVDQLTVMMHTDDGTLPDGAYALTVTADGVTTSCAFTIARP